MNFNLKESNYKIYDFMKWSYMAFSLSIILIILSIFVILVRNFNLGIDFKGGTLIEIHLNNSFALYDIRNSLNQNGFINLSIRNFGNTNDIIIRMPIILNEKNQELSNKIFFIINQITNQEAILKRIDYVGPSIGNEMIHDGMIALFLALFSIMLYISIRFEWRLATGSIIALIHDIIITLGVLSLLNIEINMTIIASIMSVIGYSLNDSIVIADRIRENFFKFPLQCANNIFNMSLTQTLKRTIITSTTTVIVLLVLLFFGGEILYGFAITLLIGVIIGTISSIYVSSIIPFKLGIKYEHLYNQ